MSEETAFKLAALTADCEFGANNGTAPSSSWVEASPKGELPRVLNGLCVYRLRGVFLRGVGPLDVEIDHWPKSENCPESFKIQVSATRDPIFGGKRMGYNPSTRSLTATKLLAESPKFLFEMIAEARRSA